MGNIAGWMKRIKKWADRKGWGGGLCERRADAATGMPPEKPDAIGVGSKIALIHSELSECLEEVRNGPLHYLTYWESGKPCGAEIELADAMIRIFHVAEELGLDLESAIDAKMQYNQNRPYKHGGKAS